MRIVVPFTPGGQPDIVARLMAPRLTETLGQQVIVDNRPGAGGMIGARIVVASNPDGHTLLSVSAAHVVTPAARANLGYDPARDFAGITLTYIAAYYLVVPTSLEVRTVKDLVARSRRQRQRARSSASSTARSPTPCSGRRYATACRRLDWSLRRASRRSSISSSWSS